MHVESTEQTLENMLSKNDLLILITTNLCDDNIERHGRTVSNPHTFQYFHSSYRLLADGLVLTQEECAEVGVGDL